MPNFDPICEWVLRQEDSTLSGRTENLSDGAGRTRFGITSANNPTALADGFYEMGREEALQYAKAYYKHCYWFPCRGDEINNDEVAATLFNFAVNDGVGQAVQLVQHAVDAQVDGHMGPITLAKINAANATLLAEALRSEQADFYRALVARIPSRARFIEGWLRRAGRKYPNLN